MSVGEARTRAVEGMDALSEPDQLRILEEGARQVSALVGDGCVIRRREASGELIAVAADHREAEGRDRLRATLGWPALPAPAGWLGQALERDCILRIPEIAPEALIAAGLPAAQGMADVVVVPLAAAEAVIVAVRDREQMPFSFAERLALERIAAELAERLTSDDQVEPAPVRQGTGGARPRTFDGRDEERPHLLDLTSAGLWLIDAAGITLWVNESASELVGIPARELVGAAVPEFIAGTDGAFGADLYADQHSDRKLTRPDGSEVWFSATSRPLFDGRGLPAGTLMTVFEINERKRREVELRMRLQANQALVGLAEISIDAPNLKAILAESARMVSEQLDAELTAISAVDTDRRELRILAVTSHADSLWADQLRDSGPIRLREGSLSLSAIEHASPVVIDDFAGDPDYPTLAAHGIRSGAFVPLGDGQSVLTALSTKPGALGGNAVTLVESVCRMIVNYQGLIGELRPSGCGDSGLRSGPKGPLGYGCESAAAEHRRSHRRRPGA